MRKKILIFLVLALMIVPIFQVKANFDKTYNTPGGHFTIKYTTDSTGEPDNATTNSAIMTFGALLDSIRDDEVAYGFDTPKDANVEIFEQGINGHGNCGYMNFDPWFLGNTWSKIPLTPSQMPTLVALHELMHTIQFCYSLSNHGGAWITEGQARSLQDKLYTSLDSLDGTEFAGYVGQVNGFLNNPSRTLMDISYDAALWWTYITEKFGTINTEPDRGLDAYVQYWEAAQELGTAIDYHKTFDKMFDRLGKPSQTFEEAYKDFVISLLAKDLSGPNVPSKYKYFDETQSPGKYRELRVNFNETLLNGQTKGATDFIDKFAPKYYVVRPDNSDPVGGGQTKSFTIEVAVNQITNNDLFFDIITIDNDDIVNEVRVTGKNIVRTISSDVDQIVLVVSGLDNEQIDPAKYIWSFSSGSGIILDIQSPENKDGLRARAGNKSDPEKILSIVDVISAGQKVKGLTASDFSAKIGTEAATVLTANNIYGLYFLEIQAPTQVSTASKFDLEITFAGEKASVTDGVLYSDLAYDSGVVIDKSFSMNPFEKIDAAMEAAGLYVDSLLPIDQVALIEFATDANLLEGLNDVSSIRNSVLTKIENIVADGGSTSIGDGLFAAQNELFSKGNATHEKHIILLTDGAENAPLNIADVDQWIVDNDTILHVVLIGQDAQGTDLQNLALKTGGSVHFAFDPSSGTLASSLAEIYRSIVERNSKQQRVYSNAVVDTSGSWSINEGITINQAREASFVLSYKSDNSLASNFVELKLPDNSILSPTFDSVYLGNSYYGHYYFNIKNPMAGIYTIQSTGLETGNVEYYAEVAVRSPITIGMRIGLDTDISFNDVYGSLNLRVRGNQIPITATLSDDKGPILGAEVNASVITGTGYFNFREWVIPMYDDGAHADGFANDGIYGNWFTRTADLGTYIVDVHAQGTSAIYGAFTREMSEAFNIYDFGRESDQDDDGLPDVWELIHGLDFQDPTGDNGAMGDPDGDQLFNQDELREGTSPVDSDTDNGGESDYSEVKNGHDPYNPIDDLFGPPILQGHPENNKAIIEFSTHPAFTAMNLYRSTINGSTGFSLIKPNIVPNGLVEDTGLANNVKYWYRMEGIGPNGEISGFSESVMVIPKFDIQAPSGVVMINNGANKTNSVNVDLTIFGDKDTIEMRISQDSSFTGVPWKPYNNKTTFTLAGSGLQLVYVQLKDAAGNVGGSGHGEGIHSFDGIIVDPLLITATVISSSSTTTGSVTSSPAFTLIGVGISLLAIPIIRSRKR